MTRPTSGDNKPKLPQQLDNEAPTLFDKRTAVQAATLTAFKTLFERADVTEPELQAFMGTPV